MHRIAPACRLSLLTFVPNIFWAVPDDYRKAVQRIYHAPDRASFIELPLVVTAPGSAPRS